MTEFLDLLFIEYASPFILLDTVIQTGQFVDFLETFRRKREERIRWEYYIHKLSPLDDRSWDQFNRDLDGGIVMEERPSDEEITETVKQSYKIMKGFNPERG